MSDAGRAIDVRSSTNLRSCLWMRTGPFRPPAPARQTSRFPSPGPDPPLAADGNDSSARRTMSEMPKTFWKFDCVALLEDLQERSVKFRTVEDGLSTEGSTGKRCATSIIRLRDSVNGTFFHELRNRSARQSLDSRALYTRLSADLSALPRHPSPRGVGAPPVSPVSGGA